MRLIIQKTAPYTHRSGEIYHQALPLSLFVGRASVCACTASYLHYPSHIPYCNLLYALICFRIRTILLAFRRVSVCVSLYGFVFALSLPLFVGEELAPPVAPNTAITTTVAKSQPPLAPHHVLASLVKGRWIDGKAQTVASLRLLAIYPHFLFAKLFCRQDGGIATPPTFPNPHYPTRFS